MGIEPTYAAWEAAVLPLNYTRGGGDCTPEPAVTGTAARPVVRVRSRGCYFTSIVARMPPSASFFVDITSSNTPVRTGRNHHSVVWPAEISRRRIGP